MAELGTVVALIKSMSGADPAVIEQAVQDWLDDHPEATTTVQDGSITEAKLAQDVLAEMGEIEELKEAIVPIENEVFISVAGIDDLYELRSEDMLLALNATDFTQGSTLYGFYVPIDPSINTTITIERTNIGKRFRVVSCHDVPAVNVTYSSGKVEQGDYVNKITYDKIESTDRYLYVAYYSTSQDTMTKEQCLAGMSIYYGTQKQAAESRKISRIENLYYEHEAGFVNGSINSSGVFSNDAKVITSDFIRADGDFMIAVPSDYVMKIHLFDDEETYISTTQKTDSVSVLSHKGLVRFSISASDESDITPETVDFSKIKMPGNRYSARAYTDSKTFVLDAENSTDADVYAYLDESVSRHGMYVTKTLLCTESSGLPIYYYTLGNGAKKVCLVGGQHGGGEDGDPRDSVITLAKVIRDLIDGNFADGSFLKELHDDYTVLVIPVLNPYGFNNRTRENADGDDLNRDWADPATIEVTAAKTLISTFSPDIAIDVHCNGTTPVYNEDIEIQFGLGTHNTTFKSAVQSKFKSYYDTDVEIRSPNTETTLQYYIITTLGILGGLIELRWWSKSSKWMHDAQAESANYAMLVNVLRFCSATNDSGTYVWEHTPNQNQY